MPKASPQIRSFNAGEVSEWLRGRTDLEKHSSSLQRMMNFIAAPQGPAIARSGTKHITMCANPSEPSYIQPFIFSNDDAYVLEFASDRMRVMRNDDILSYSEEPITVLSEAGEPLVFESATLAAVVGDDVLIRTLQARVTEVNGNTYTTNQTTTTSIHNAAKKVFHLPTDFTLEERQTLRFVQSLDVIYVLNEHGRVRKIIRRSDFEWSIEEVLFQDGPYLSRTDDDGTTLTLSSTGGLLGSQTSTSSSTNRPLIDGTNNNGTETDVRFLGRAIDYLLPASLSAFAFDVNTESYWAGGVAQVGAISATYADAQVVTGYTVYASRDNQDGTYLNKDYAPSSWSLQARNGAGAWVTIDTQEDYVFYDNDKSIFFEVNNSEAYTSYQLLIRKLVTNGSIEARVRALVLKASSQSLITVTASSTKGINFDSGFKATDVDRSLRMRGSDNAWRELRIAEYVSPTVVKAMLIGEPFIDTLPIKRWRLGVWSDTTGWPAVGTFFSDRLFLGGAKVYEDTLAMSVVGSYEAFSPTDSFGVVEDANGGVFTLNARKLGRIRWMEADNRGVLMGTGSAEYTVRSSSGPFTARTANATPSTGRGSAAIEPVLIDDATLFVQRSARTLRAFKYIFEADGYRSPSLSNLASHFGSVRFAEIKYAAEPHGILWMRREDGTLIGFTYDPEQNVQGWHQHDLSGEVVSITVIPDTEEQFDQLWLVVKRQMLGADSYRVERMTRAWDFDMVLSDAWFVDAGLKYEGALTDVISGLDHLEGLEVYGLIDNTPTGPHTVESGRITVEFPTETAVIGVGFESEGVTSEIMNGAADGTAAGKTGRIHNATAAVWQTGVLEVGIWIDDETHEDKGFFEYEEVELPSSFDEIEETELFTGMAGPFSLSPSYTQETVLAFRRAKNIPLPMNIIALMPQLHKQDR